MRKVVLLQNSLHSYLPGQHVVSGSNSSRRMKGRSDDAVLVRSAAVTALWTLTKPSAGAEIEGLTVLGFSALVTVDPERVLL